MPQPAKPFIFRGWYCTNYGGVAKQKLCRVEEGMRAADLALKRLQVQRADAEQEGKVTVAGPGIQSGLPPLLSTQVAANAYGPGLAGPQGKLVYEIHDEFLDAKRTETEGLTYVSYRDKLVPFYERFGQRPVRSLTHQDGLEYKRWLMD